MARFLLHFLTEKLKTQNSADTILFFIYIYVFNDNFSAVGAVNGFNNLRLTLGV